MRYKHRVGCCMLEWRCVYYPIPRPAKRRPFFRRGVSISQIVPTHLKQRRSPPQQVRSGKILSAEAAHPIALLPRSHTSPQCAYCPPPSAYLRLGVPACYITVPRLRTFKRYSLIWFYIQRQQRQIQQNIVIVEFHRAKECRIFNALLSCTPK